MGFTRVASTTQLRPYPLHIRAPHPLHRIRPGRRPNRRLRRLRIRITRIVNTAPPAVFTRPFRLCTRLGHGRICRGHSRNRPRTLGPHPLQQHRGLIHSPTQARYIRATQLIPPQPRPPILHAHTQLGPVPLGRINQKRPQRTHQPHQLRNQSRPLNLNHIHLRRRHLRRRRLPRRRIPHRHLPHRHPPHRHLRHRRRVRQRLLRRDGLVRPRRLAPPELREPCLSPRLALAERLPQ